MKILVAEDERWTREALARELTEIGRHEVAQAADGEEALAALESFAPDVVLADIRMPKLDGLSLLERAKQGSGLPLFVIVSSYDSFDYARTALERGAFAYLLKPVATDELIRCLARAEARIRRDLEHESRMSEADRRAREYLELANKRLLRQWIEEEKTDAGELRAHLDAMGVALEGERCVVVTAGIDEFERLTAGKPSSDAQLYNYCVENMALELFAKLGLAAVPFGGDSEQGFLVGLPGDRELEERFYDTLDKLVEAARRYFRFSVTVGAGLPAENLAAVHQSYSQAKQAAMTRLAQGGNRVYRYREMEARLTAPDVVVDWETEQELYLSMEQGDQTQAKAILEALYRRANGQTKNFMKLNFNVAVTLQKLLNRLGLPPEPFLGSELKLYRQLNGCTSLEQLLRLLAEILDTAFAEMRKNEQLWDRSVMAKAMAYILRHYNEDISLQTVSDHIHLSPAYLSKQFKKTYNRNFIEFLIQYRMEKARELLKSGQYTANEVAGMVGFKDEKHFFRTFKKLVGVTPGTYKKGRAE